MAPIRTGLIGLAATATPSILGAWGVMAHLRSIQGLPDDYELVAVANSSVESAQRSIDFHKLHATVKAYGSPEEIAADPNVELVVVSVAVSRHFFLAKPALEHKKAVFVEWPLGASLKEAEDMVKLASANGVKTMVGVQGRHDPLTQKVKEILASGKIGKITSSTVTASTSQIPADAWAKGAEWYLDIKSGGNEFTIIFGHFLDSFTYLLGDFDQAQGLLSSQYPTIPIIDMATGEIANPARSKTAPDHILVQGRLESGAVVSLAFRKPKSTVDKTGFRWYITGTEGEILITTEENAWQMPSTASTRSITVVTGKGSEAETMDYSGRENSAASKVASPGTNTARQYEAFAKGAEIATFESALRTHSLLDKIAKSSGVSLH